MIKEKQFRGENVQKLQAQLNTLMGVEKGPIFTYDNVEAKTSKKKDSSQWTAEQKLANK